MTETNQKWTGALERTHTAVRDFARREFNTCARRLVHRLQRIPASGIYGDNLGHKTLWDEFCYEKHNGPTAELQLAWHQAIDPHLESVIESIPRETAVLLSVHSCWELQEDLEVCGSIWPDGIKDVLQKTLINHAMSRRSCRIGNGCE